MVSKKNTPDTAATASGNNVERYVPLSNKVKHTVLSNNGQVNTDELIRLSGKAGKHRFDLVVNAAGVEMQWHILPNAIDYLSGPLDCWRLIFLQLLL